MHDDKMFASTLLAAFACTGFAVLSVSTGLSQTSAKVRTVEPLAVISMSRLQTEPPGARIQPTGSDAAKGNRSRCARHGAALE